MSNQRLAVYWHPDVLKHDPGRGCYEFEASPLMAIDEPHPETPDRIVNIRSILQRGPIRDRILWCDGRRASREEVERFHDPSYVDEVLLAERSAPVRIDGSGTVVNTGTTAAIMAAAGTTIAAVEGARAAGCKRVAVIDWDVHHGNGTQSGFYHRPDVLTISLHMPLGAWGENHPETGEVDEIGEGTGRGLNLNIPLPYGSGDQAYAAAMDQLVEPAVRRFDPDLIVVACGQDANQLDQNGRNLLSMAGFQMLGRAIRELATELCNGRLLLCQEGGYAITYTGFCMYAVAEGVLGIQDPMEDPLAYDASIEQPEAALAAIARIKDAVGGSGQQRLRLEVKMVGPGGLEPPTNRL